MCPLRRPGRPTTSVVAIGFILAAVALCAAALSPSSAHAADYPKYVTAHGNCVEGTWTVPHGVTRISVDVTGAPGQNGPDYQRYDNYGTYINTNYGGKGGYG